MELFTIHCVPSIDRGGVIRADLLDLRQHGLIGFAALLLIFCTVFIRMDAGDGFALLLFQKVLFSCIDFTNFGNIVFHNLIKSVFIIHEINPFFFMCSFLCIFGVIDGSLQLS